MRTQPLEVGHGEHSLDADTSVSVFLRTVDRWRREADEDGDLRAARIFEKFIQATSEGFGALRPQADDPGRSPFGAGAPLLDARWEDRAFELWDQLGDAGAPKFLVDLAETLRCCIGRDSDWAAAKRSEAVYAGLADDPNTDKLMLAAHRARADETWAGLDIKTAKHNQDAKAEEQAIARYRTARRRADRVQARFLISDLRRRTQCAATRPQGSRSRQSRRTAPGRHQGSRRTTSRSAGGGSSGDADPGESDPDGLILSGVGR